MIILHLYDANYEEIGTTKFSFVEDAKDAAKKLGVTSEWGDTHFGYAAFAGADYESASNHFEIYGWDEERDEIRELEIEDHKNR